MGAVVTWGDVWVKWLCAVMCGSSDDVGWCVGVVVMWGCSGVMCGCSGDGVMCGCSGDMG